MGLPRSDNSLLFVILSEPARGGRVEGPLAREKMTIRVFNTDKGSFDSPAAADSLRMTKMVEYKTAPSKRGGYQSQFNFPYNVIRKPGPMAVQRVTLLR